MSATRIYALTAFVIALSALSALSAHAAPPTIAGCQVFPAQNVWNTPVDTLRPHASSDAWVATIGPARSLHPDFGTFYLGDPIGIPFVTVPGTQPAVPVAFDEPGESDPSPYPIPPDAPIEGGSASDGDRHVLVLERTGCILHELGSAFPVGGGSSWTAFSGARFNLNLNAMRPATWTSADAAGLPILPGLVRYDEVVAGEINHAIRFTAPQTRNAFIWPATHQASSLTGTQYPPMGARFRLKAGVDISGYPAQVQVILKALKKYGMLLADNGSAWFISGEHNTLWNDGVLVQMGSLHGSDFEAVETAPMVISPSSSKAFLPPPAVTLREVASGLAAPVEIANAADGSGRLFVAEQGGAIRILKNGMLLPTPFLDIASRLTGGGERGLLGLAFHPQFASNRRFFVFYTLPPDGSLRVSSFLASAANPDLADPASEVEIITIAHPVNANHNGGHLAFGPDGYLYIGTGDGGAGGDPPNNAQNLSVLLGKLLRLDVSTASGYAIPAANPAYAGIPGARREIWSYGLRNPWKFSFDRMTGDLYIGDVGQGAIEEVDYVAAGTPGGLNFGWRVFEGMGCYNATSCSLANHTPPVQQYAHDSNGGFSITGGYVYRGARSAALRGYYLYGDYVSNRIWASTHEGSAWTSFVLFEPPTVLSGVSSFGEDESGEIYVASHATGRIYAIDAPPEAAVITSPVPGATLAGTSQLFQWTSPPGAMLYQVWVGTSPGGLDIGYFPAAGTMATSLTIAGLPRNGATLYVRLYTAIGGVYYFNDYTYMAAAAPTPVPASITSPANGTTLAGASQLFQWNSAAGATNYQVWIGNSVGAHDLGFFPAAGTPGTSTTVTGLPVDGRTLYVRLYSLLGGTYFFRDFTYTAATAAAPTPASITSPANGSMLTGASQLFQWNSATGATNYQVWVGNSLGAHDLGFFPAAGTPGTSTTVTGLPMDGRLLYVRLYSLIGGTYYSRDFTYTAAAGATPNPAAITSPANGATLTGASQLFQWNSAAGATNYQVWVGNTLGAHDLGFFPAAGTPGTSTTVTGLPVDGRTLYVRLWSLIGGTYYSRDATYMSGP